MKKILILLTMLVPVNAAWACRCISLTFETEVKSSEKIFHGRVVAVDHYTFDVEVIRVWKGEFPGGIFQLIQGETSCETRTFELNKEYVFYVEGTSVFNCSRTSGFVGSLDPELLDLKFYNVGDKESIESDNLTSRELEILKLLLETKGIEASNIDQKVLFAIQDSWVNKWTFFETLTWSDIDIKVAWLGEYDNSGPVFVWAGNRWVKSIGRLTRSRPKG